MSIEGIDGNSIYFDKKCVNMSLAFTTHKKFSNNIHHIDSERSAQIKCSHNGKDHELCNRIYIWPNIVHCDLQLSFHDLSIKYKQLKSKEILKHWTCEGDSIMSLSIVIKCDKLKDDPCEMSLDNCYVVFDPVVEYDIILSIIVVIFFMGILIIVIVIWMITQRKRKHHKIILKN